MAPTTSPADTTALPAPAGSSAEDLVRALQARDYWQASELDTPGVGRTVLAEGPWIETMPVRYNGATGPYPGSLSGCILGASYGFVVEEGPVVVSSRERDVVAVYDCAATKTPEAAQSAVIAIVFGGPTIGLAEDGSSLTLRSDDGVLRFRSVAGAATVALMTAPSWTAIEVDGEPLEEGPTIESDGRITGCLLGGTFAFAVEDDGPTAVFERRQEISDLSCSIAETDRPRQPVVDSTIDGRPSMEFTLGGAEAPRLRLWADGHAVEFAPTEHP